MESPSVLKTPRAANFFNVLVDAWVHLFFPLSCLHCEALVETRSRLLCQKCEDLLELLEIEGRCPRCFNESLKCLHGEEVPFLAQGGCFAYEGPAASLIKAFKYQNMPHLAKPLASWMVLQWSKLNWPLPDFITCVPMNCVKKFERGYNQSFELAKAFSEMVDRPVLEPLKRRFGDFSQARLSEKMRHEEKLDTIYLFDPKQVFDQTILLIDDVITTGNTLEKTGLALLEGAPKAIYSLTFAKTSSFSDIKQYKKIAE